MTSASNKRHAEGSEASRYRAMFDATGEAILLMDGMRLVDCNARAPEMFGCSRAELLQRPPHLRSPLFQPDGETSAAKATALLVAAAGGVPQHFEWQYLRSDGSLFTAEVNLNSVECDGCRQVVAVLRDITERKRYELELEARNESLRLLNRISESLHRSPEIGSIAEHTIEALLSYNRPPMVAVYLLDSDGEELRLLANHGFSDRALRAGSRLSIRDSLSGLAVVGEQLLWAEDIRQDGRLQAASRDAFLAAGVRTLVAVPLLYQNGALGVFLLGFRETRRLPPHERDILNAIGRTVGLAMANARNLQGLKAEMKVRLRTEEVLRESNERYQAYIANSSDGIVRYDLEPPVPIDLPVGEQIRLIGERGRIAEVNPQALKMQGYRHAEEVVGEPLGSHAAEPRQIADAIDDFVRHGYRLSRFEAGIRNVDGSVAWAEISAIGMVEGQKLVRIWSTLRDIRERREHMAKLEYQATHDALTGLPNRKWLVGRIDERLQAPQGHRAGLALLLIDLDRFKEINDTLGHHVGDLLLQQVGPRLTPLLAGGVGDIARLGGDEFAILLYGVEDRQRLEAQIQRLLDAIHSSYRLNGMDLEVGASAGIALYPQHGADASTLLRCADVAMYLAKKEASNYAFYRPEQDDYTPQRLLLMTELGNAVRSDQLCLYFQPQVGLDPRRPVGFEALVRWQHPRRGLLLPGDFIPLAEISEHIGPLTLWVIDHALAQWRLWHEQGMDCSIAVNLSPRNLMDERCPANIRRLLERHGVDPHCLELEITESAIIADPDRALLVLNEIHALGVRLAIDDFGTGYSSLSYLKKLPIDSLKIDLSFVRNMLDDDQDAVIVNSTVNLAHNLGLQVVAEGVEDRETLDVLAAIRCDQVQGFHIGRPMPAEAALAWWQGAAKD
ncbi:EAL domain-containing protein [Thiohalobacter sp. IOR34]|uniref:sensor domain-containing protein n=1 Tax=Thiohalobacter sp. IOR34 TaxID=3057176 RepID=UPI0025B015B9|nr:EAL domain-containing protein [Thiohalobacter sp. IOR34]WJW76270.1 EAL domain-containing protein [Thiohalobacter sp. IOR34]